MPEIPEVKVFLHAQVKGPKLSNLKKMAACQSNNTICSSSPEKPIPKLHSARRYKHSSCDIQHTMACNLFGSRD